MFMKNLSRILLTSLLFTNMASATDFSFDSDSYEADKRHILPESFTHVNEVVETQERDLEEIFSKKLRELQKSYSTVVQQRDHTYFSLEERKVEVKNASSKIEELTAQLKRSETQRDETWAVYQKANARIEQLEELQKKISKELIEVKESRHEHEKARNETWHVYLKSRDELNAVLQQIDQVHSSKIKAEIREDELQQELMEKEKQNKKLEVRTNELEVRANESSRNYHNHLNEISRLTAEAIQLREENHQLIGIDELLGSNISYTRFLRGAQKKGIQINDIANITDSYTPLQKTRIKSVIGVRVLQKLLEIPITHEALIIDALNVLVESSSSNEGDDE